MNALPERLQRDEDYLMVMASMAVPARLPAKFDMEDAIQDALLRVHRDPCVLEGRSFGERRAYLKSALASALADQIRRYRTLGRDREAWDSSPRSRGGPAGTGRRLALKVLPAWGLPDSEARERFRRQDDALARLDHPNILPILKLDSMGGIPYPVMPLVDGPDLRMIRRRLARGGGSASDQGPQTGQPVATPNRVAIGRTRPDPLSPNRLSRS